MSNDCYRSYTNKSNLKQFEKCEEIAHDDTVSNNSVEVNNLRKSQRHCESQQINHNKCIICGKSSNKKVTALCEIGQDRSEFLLQAAKYFEDAVYTKICTFNSSEDLLASKIKYHASCFREYERKYERSQKKTTNKLMENSSECSSELEKIMNEIFESIKPRIYLGEHFSLRDISNMIVQKYGSHFTVKNSKIKSCLIDYFGENIAFVYPKEKNKAQIFFSSQIKYHPIESQVKNCVEECADILLNSLKEMDFNLKDKLCNENELKEAWMNQIIPEPFLIFFSRFFQCSQKDIQQKFTDFDDETPHDSSIKSIRIKSLFQIMYYVKKGGRVDTPLHILLGIFVYTYTKSKSTLSVLNRLGLTVSYDEILRIRARLATFIIENHQNKVPLPYHFNTRNYVTAAFDNFDCNEATISGLNSTHDTVIVVFQDLNTNEDGRNCSYPELNLKKRERVLTNLLECQKLIHYRKTDNSVDLPSSYKVCSLDQVVNHEEFTNNFNIFDIIWLLSRIDISEYDKGKVSIHNSAEQVIPSWSPFNSVMIEDNRPVQNVGFLPILPFPVTDYSTVYTCLLNFKNLLSSLEQSYLPVFCDEGVYKIARHITLTHKEEFDKIILCLGGFHITKVLHGCIGKYLNESGIKNLFIETELFGMNVINQILEGKHYARCVKAYNYLGEAFRRLQIEEFITEENLIDCENEIVQIILFKESFSTGDFHECKGILSNLKKVESSLSEKFKEFILKRCQESQTFRYWNNVLILIDLMHDLIRADRMGDWELHLATIKKLLPVFHAMDRTNYSRWCSVYLEDMLSLQEQAPEVYRQFMKGRFTVKKSPVPFTSVASDQALEQTINRAFKSISGVIGSTKNKETVTVWEITRHEFLAIGNFLKEATTLINQDEQCTHHEFSKASTEISESSVEKILTYVESRRANPFKSGSHKLQNLITEELVQPEIAIELLNIFEKGVTLYKEFRIERFITREKCLSAVISRNNFPNFKSTIAHDSKKCNKKRKWPTCLIIDVMLVLRKIGFKNSRHFKDLADNFCKYVFNQSMIHNTKRIDFIFDSYFSYSIKSSEHLRRTKSESINYCTISEETFVPKQEEKFWSSSHNKILLQKFIRSFINQTDAFARIEIICSTINDLQCISNSSSTESLEILQRTDVEEADHKIIIHIKHAIDKGYEHVYLVSSDTDVIVLALYFMKEYVACGLKASITQKYKFIMLHHKF